MTIEHNVTFPTRWINTTQFEQALSQASTSSFSLSAGVTFHFPASCKLMVSAAVRLLSLANQLTSEGVPVTMAFEDEQNGVMGYLSRANFFTLLSKQVRILPTRPDPAYARRYHGYNKGLVEFEAISNTDSEQNQDIPTRLADSLKIAMEMRDDHEAFSNAAFTIFGELINNIYDHSQTQLDGFAALQVYPRGDEVQVVVSDSGIGLLETLRPKLLTETDKTLSDAELIRCLFENELQWDHKGNGQGLRECARKALRYNGSVDIRQTTCSVQLRPFHGSYERVNTVYQSNLVGMKGTHVCFSFNLP